MDPAAHDAVVTFAGSQVEQGWTSGDLTLLEFAKNHDLTPAFGCRSSICGSYGAKLKSGIISYIAETGFQPKSDDVLICCAVPAKSDNPLVLDL